MAISSNSCRAGSVQIIRAVAPCAFWQQHERQPDLQEWLYLAELHKETDRLDPAIKAIQQAETIMRELESARQFYPDILLSLANLLAQTGSFEQAGQTYIQSAEKCQEIRGTDSPGCVRIYRNAGDYLYSIQRFNEARIYLEQAPKTLTLTLEPGHEDLKTLEQRLATIAD